MTQRVVWVGVDPASKTGLFALSIDSERPGWRDAWRFVDAVAISKSSRQGATGAENELALFDKALDFMTRHRTQVVAIERPSDMAGTFIQERGGQKQRGQRTGTAFAIGAAYGVCAAAGRCAGARVFDFAVTSARATKSSRERTGWMPMVRSGRRDGRGGGLLHTMKREDLLEKLHERSLEIRARPLDGMSRDEYRERLDENILMAMGVLLFHLSRQVG
jgi:hypothetical protein